MHFYLEESPATNYLYMCRTFVAVENRAVMKKVLPINGAESALSFSEKENRCQSTFNHCIREGERFFHLCTPGDNQQVIFSSKDDYEAAMLLFAVSLSESPGVRVITFEWMSNHLHSIMLGTISAIDHFFSRLKNRLMKYLKQDSKTVSLKHFVPNIIPIDTLESLRNQIAYTNRNNYLVNPDETPFSYPYGANAYFFNPFAKQQPARRYGELTVREKKELIHSHQLSYPDDFKIRDNYFTPDSFCEIDLGEAMFRDARHYFHKITREIESYREIAAMLGDSVFYTDDELISVLYGICNKEYNGQKPLLLPAQEKLAVARRLHFDYNADNAKIARLLRIDRGLLETIFGNK